jgi:hypothetical protein
MNVQMHVFIGFRTSINNFTSFTSIINYYFLLLLALLITSIIMFICYIFNIFILIKKSYGREKIF